MAGDARKAARRALIPHQHARPTFVVDAEKLGDRIEAPLLGLFPSRKDLVRAAAQRASVAARRGERRDDGTHRGFGRDHRALQALDVTRELGRVEIDGIGVT